MELQDGGRGRRGGTAWRRERRLREAAAGCGRARVLDPVAAELLRYREVREQYGRVTGARGGGGVSVAELLERPAGHRGRTPEE